jgi:glycosyltransferase involved in cell wall biosynthesis
MDDPFVSIVIPSRNEKMDIKNILDACLNFNYPNCEIIVVDDSIDTTPDIVREYLDQGVKLIHREKNTNGCCGARNLGMQLALGEILVLFNADDHPSPDFVQQILEHYLNGADYVVCRSRAMNIGSIWGRYRYSYELVKPIPDPEWSEGFSCRSDAARAVGYIPGDFPIPFCRDFTFGKKLREEGFIKIYDPNIIVRHRAPDNFMEFWSNQKWRGTFAPPHNYYFRHMTLRIIWLREILKVVRRFLYYFLLIPVMVDIINLASKSPKKWFDLPGFFLVTIIQDCAQTVGNFQGIRRLNQTIYLNLPN